MFPFKGSFCGGLKFQNWGNWGNSLVFRKLWCWVFWAQKGRLGAKTPKKGFFWGKVIEGFWKRGFHLFLNLFPGIARFFGHSNKGGGSFFNPQGGGYKLGLERLICHSRDFWRGAQLCFEGAFSPKCCPLFGAGEQFCAFAVYTFLIFPPRGI